MSTVVPMSLSDSQPLSRWGILMGLMLSAGSWLSAPAMAQGLFYAPRPNPDLTQAQGLQLASDALRLGQFGQQEEALNRLGLAAILVPNSPEILFLLGGLHLEFENYRESLNALQIARDLDPDNVDILVTLGSAYLRQGSYFAALDVLQQAVDLGGEDAGAFFQLGNAHLMLANFDAAETAYDTALELDPNFWPALNNIGLVEYERGNLDQAIVRFEQTIELNGDIAEPKLGLATALFIQGETEAAEQLGAEAIRLDISYTRLDVLRMNLWGPEMMRDVQMLLRTSSVKDALRQATLEAIDILPGL
ncbi:MAG: tetratricopeptide repeat protein [Cyanophyceae cyanobacterium]